MNKIISNKTPGAPPANKGRNFYMYYEIIVSHNGLELFRASPGKISTVSHLVRMFFTLDTKFPENVGFDLSICIVKEVDRCLDRASFKKALVEQSFERLYQLLE
jgi:hypothetical protein